MQNQTPVATNMKVHREVTRRGRAYAAQTLVAVAEADITYTTAQRNPAEWDKDALLIRHDRRVGWVVTIASNIRSALYFFAGLLPALTAVMELGERSSSCSAVSWCVGMRVMHKIRIGKVIWQIRCEKTYALLYDLR